MLPSLKKELIKIEENHTKVQESKKEFSTLVKKI